MTPAERTRALVEEIIWWHNALAQRDDTKPVKVTVADVFGLARDRHIVIVRHDCMRRVSACRPNWSYPALGKYFNRDHTTIQYAVKGPTFRNRKNAKSGNVVSSQFDRLSHDSSALTVSP